MTGVNLYNSIVATAKRAGISQQNFLPVLNAAMEKLTSIIVRVSNEGYFQRTELYDTQSSEDNYTNRSFTLPVRTISISSVFLKLNETSDFEELHENLADNLHFVSEEQIQTLAADANSYKIVGNDMWVLTDKPLEPVPGGLRISFFQYPAALSQTDIESDADIFELNNFPTIAHNALLWNTLKYIAIAEQRTNRTNATNHILNEAQVVTDDMINLIQQRNHGRAIPQTDHILRV